MKTILITQDHDNAILYNSDDTLITAPAVSGGKIIGINLMYKNHLLGTFDSCNEAIEEINNIANSSNHVYCISGYSDYDGTFDFWKSVVESGEIDFN